MQFRNFVSFVVGAGLACMLSSERSFAAGAPAADPLDEVVVTATRAVTGTKTDTPLIEIPQSMSVITREQMDEQNAQSLAQALEYTPGLAAESRMGFSGYDIVYSRGFTLDRFVDGMKVLGGLGYTAPQIEPYGIERLEVLRGPASTLYGSASSGGLVNAISKRPTDVPLFSAEVQAGNYHDIQGAFDLGGPLDKDGDVLYRLTALARHSDTQVEFTREDRYFVAPALTWRVDGNTSLTILAQYQRDPNLGLYSLVPSIGTVIDSPYGSIPTSRYLGEPSYNELGRTEASIGYAFEHHFGSQWTFRQNARYQHTNGDVQQLLPLEMLDDRTLLRYSLADTEHINAITLDNQVEGSFSTGRFAHRVLLGADFQRLSDAEVLGEDLADPIDVFSPIYGASIPAPPTVSDTGQVQKQYGIYAQDQIKYDALVLTAGIRNDWASEATDDRMANATTSQDAHAFTGRGGLTYLLPGGLAPYFNYSRSFQPTPGIDFNGRPFDPVTGTQTELGLKYASEDKRYSASAAVFDLKQENVLTPDPDHPFFLVQTGETRSRGAELEGRISMTDRLSTTLSYTHLDARVTRSNGPDLDKRPLNVPQNSAAAWAYYTVPVATAQALSLGGGLRYVGPTWGDTANTLQVSSFVVADAALRWNFSTSVAPRSVWSMSVNIANMFDRQYVSECSNDVSCLYGNRRTASIALKYAR